MIPVSGRHQRIFVVVAKFDPIALPLRHIGIPISLLVRFILFLIPVVVKPRLIRVHDILPFPIQADGLPGRNIRDQGRLRL